MSDMRAHIKTLVDKAPPFTAGQRERITALLRTGQQAMTTSEAAEPEQVWQIAA
ncbi:hypothetical protein [Nocardia sp. NPDC050175]|uniref:hypothetical protein n=1 Tax=Nocardia sp. NPDC050175 TaxID=3364317 RepID=UPI0037B53D81